MNLSELEDILRKSTFEQGLQLHVSVPNFTIPIAIRILYAPPLGVRLKTLIFTFHGSVDRTKRKIPVFEGRFLIGKYSGINESLVIGLSDPMLEIHEKLRTTWFAGGDALNTPELIRVLIRSFVEVLNPDRTLFIGVSTGGHPAILQSSYLPGSVCVVTNPISFISSYYSTHVEEYRAICWPSLKHGDPLPDSCSDDVSLIFKKSNASTLIYLNNARDHHFWIQATRFLYSVASVPARSRLLFVSNYYDGYSGHGTPSAFLAHWANAVCISNSLSVDDIGAAANILYDFNKNQSNHPKNAQYPVICKSLDSRDQLLSEVLRDYHLRQPLET